jgi:hypothetical protein
MGKWVKIAKDTTVIDLGTMGLLKTEVGVIKITSNEARILIKAQQKGDINGNN